MAENTFHWIDYVIFGMMFVVSTGIGIFYACYDKKKQNAANLLLGGRQMSMVPIALSLFASFSSAISVLGMPTEIYYNGTMYWISLLGYCGVIPITAYWFLPVFYELQLSSVYEYLQLRFNTVTMVIGSFVFQIQMLLYMAVVLYAPAIALNQVMNIDILVSILVIGGVCTFYTAIGGLKAVVWTDVFQSLVMFCGLVAVVVKGTMEVGGATYVWETAVNGSKIQFDNFDPNPLVRHTVWNLIIGGCVTSLTVQASNQTLIQRYLSLPTMRKARIALWLQIPGVIVVNNLLGFVGLVLYARYHDADPIENCDITKRDQLIPWLVMDVLGKYHGFPGLIVACIFSASLSTVSSGVNALALVFLVDILKPLHLKYTGLALSERKATHIARILAMAYGMFTVGLAFLAQNLGSLILQVTNSIFGVTGGPLLGLFVSAMFFPIINSWGAIAGVLCSLGMSMWLAIGAIVYDSSGQADVICPAATNTSVTFTPATTALYTTTSAMNGEQDSSFLGHFYSLSYMWYSTFAVVICVGVGILVSCCTGGTKKRPVDRRLLSPLYLKLEQLSQIGPKRNTPSSVNETALSANQISMDRTVFI